MGHCIRVVKTNFNRKISLTALFLALLFACIGIVPTYLSSQVLSIGAPGGGSVFCFTFPAAPAASRAESAEQMGVNDAIH